VPAEWRCPTGPRRTRAPPAGKPHEVGANPAANLEEPAVTEAVERHQPRQVVQLVEPVLVEILEEVAAADRMARHLQVVDARVPVPPHARAEIPG
jgi:hypothetical protein